MIQKRISTKVGIAIVLAAAVVLVGGATAYFWYANSQLPMTNSQSNASKVSNSLNLNSENQNYSFQVQHSSVSVISNGEIIQSLLPPDKDSFDFIATNTLWKDNVIISDQDINFDGYNDVAIVTGNGYGGVNFFYDYYVFNPTTRKFEKSLSDVCNPDFKPSEKVISSSCKEGPTYCNTIYTFNGEKYVKGKTTNEISNGAGDEYCNGTNT